MKPFACIWFLCGWFRMPHQISHGCWMRGEWKPIIYINIICLNSRMSLYSKREYMSSNYVCNISTISEVLCREYCLRRNHIYILKTAKMSEKSRENYFPQQDDQRISPEGLISKQVFVCFGSFFVLWYMDIAWQLLELNSFVLFIWLVLDNGTHPK